MPVLVTKSESLSCAVNELKSLISDLTDGDTYSENHFESRKDYAKTMANLVISKINQLSYDGV